MSSRLARFDAPSRRAVAAILSAIAVALAVGLSSIVAQQRPAPSLLELDVPYVPTPSEVVERMLRLADVRPGDRLIDLGSGDGRIAIAAAKHYGIEAFGVDIDPKRVAEARANAEKAGVADKVRFEVQNLFDTRIADATVLTLYLLPDVNLELRPRLLSELKPATRVVSHQFDMGDWQPDRTESIGHRMIYLWIIPAR